MSGAVDYPIQERLHVLQEHYKQFTQSKEALVCRWVLEADEFMMFNSFFGIEISAVATSADLFLKFEAPFEGGQSYHRDLYQELHTNLKDYLATDKPSKPEVTWRPPKVGNYEKLSATFFTEQLIGFRIGLPDLEDMVIAWLAPSMIESDGRFQKWIGQQLELNPDDKIRYMILDYVDAPRFEALAESHPKKVMSIQPNLEMAEAMKASSAAAGKPDDPDVKFRAAFIDMSKAVSKKRMADVEKHASTAIEICLAEDWKHLHIGVLIAYGSAWIGEGNNDNALEKYLVAENIAKQAKDDGDEVAGNLLITVLFSKGTVYIQKKDYEEGANVYGAIPPLTEENPHQRIEAWRMKGYCEESARAYKEACISYEKALETAETIEREPEEAKKSTLPYIGAALIRLYDTNRDMKKLNKRLEKLMGPNWET